jgi:AraC-like DNA-binding protein
MNLRELHQSNPKTFPQLALDDQLFLHYKCPQVDHVAQFYLDHNQFNFTLNGNRIIRNGDHKWVSDKGKGLMFKRAAFAQELPSEFADWEVLVFYLRDDYLKSILEEFRPYLDLTDLPAISPFMLDEIAVDPIIRNCYESLTPYFTRPQQLPKNIFEAKFKELLFNILKHPSNRHILAYVNQITDGYLVPVWQVMEANYMYNLKIPEFARIANRSTSTFRREFERYYKTTPGKWLADKRLERAQRMLVDTGKTISEIAFDCGYENISHFTRVFKEKHNLPPSRFRQKQI